METKALITMILLLVLIWGGFAYTLRLAIKKEQEKKENLSE